MKLNRWIFLISASLFVSVVAKNRRFDPSSGRSRLCSIPAFQNATGDAYTLPNTQGYCSSPGDSSLPTGEALNVLATAYAPVLFFHPLEEYTLASVNETFAVPQDGGIFVDLPGYDPQVFKNTLDLDAMLNSTRDLNFGLYKDSFFIKHQLTSDYVRGAGFDSNGKSRAVIYYHAMQEQQYWVFQYFMYYTYHGPISTSLVSSGAGKTFTTMFNIRPFGEHEGDWQSISVLVCNNETVSTPLAVSYRQHNWTTVEDCTKGECTFYKNTVHPVGFVALQTHATYSEPAARMIFAEFETDFFVNLQGVFGYDNTAYEGENNTYRYFMPNETNVVQHLDPAAIGFSSNQSEYWQGFAGRWGGPELYGINVDYQTQPPGRMILPFPQCYDANGTQVVTCPTSNNPIFVRVMQMLNVLRGDPNSVASRADRLYRAIASFVTGTGTGPRGPITSREFHNWLPPVNSPIRAKIGGNVTAQEFCKQVEELLILSRIPADVAQINLRRNVIGITIFCVFVMIGNVFFFTHPRFRGSSKPPLYIDDSTGKVNRPDWRLAFTLFRPAILYLLFYVATMVGTYLYFVGYASLVDILETTVGLDLSSVKKLSYLFGITVVVIDTAMVVLIWFPSHVLWVQVQIAYFTLTGHEEKANRFKRMACCGQRVPLLVFQVMYGVLFNSMILSIMCVLIGCIDVGIAYAVGDKCTKFEGAVGSICINLYQIGVTINCGTDFQNFCNQWATKEAIATLWGAIVVVAGHYYLINFCGAASSLAKDTPSILKMLPSRQEYQEGLERCRLMSTPVEEERAVSSSNEPTDDGSQLLDPPAVDQEETITSHHADNHEIVMTSQEDPIESTAHQESLISKSDAAEADVVNEDNPKLTNEQMRNVFFCLLAWACTVCVLTLVVGTSSSVLLSIGGDKSISSMPLGAIFLGSSLVSCLVTPWLFREWGRKKGFVFGIMLGLVGSGLAALSVWIRSSALFIIANAFFGAAMGVGFYLRFAAVELVPKFFAARAVTLTVSGGCLAAFVGPEVAQATRDLFSGEHLQYMGIFLMTAVFNVANLTFTCLVTFPLATPSKEEPPRYLDIIRQRSFFVPMLIASFSWVIMALPMSVVRVAMADVGYSTRQSLTTIELHFLGMYAPGFFTGHLISKFGPRNVCWMSIIIFAGALLFMLLSDNAQSGSAAVWMLGLVFVGVGWNMCFNGATVWLAALNTPSAKSRVQAANDCLMFALSGAWIFSASYIYRAGGNDLNGWKTLNFVVVGLAAGLAMLIGFDRRIQEPNQAAAKEVDSKEGSDQHDDQEIVVLSDPV